MHVLSSGVDITKAAANLLSVKGLIYCVAKRLKTCTGSARWQVALSQNGITLKARTPRGLCHPCHRVAKRWRSQRTYKLARRPSDLCVFIRCLPQTVNCYRIITRYLKLKTAESIRMFLQNRTWKSPVT
jgi:hypothetical protein